MGRIVIACYKPKPGKEVELDELMKNHLEILKKQNLVTDRKSILMKAENGTVIEVFEWKSREAIEKAHENPTVLEMWKAYEAVCEYIPLSQLPETKDLFSEFSPFE